MRFRYGFTTLRYGFTTLRYGFTTLRYGLTTLLLIILISPSSRAQTFFTAHLTAAQESQAIDSTGAGTAALVLDDDGLRFFVSVDSLSGPIQNAHFHQAPTGVDGGVVRGILDDFDGNSASGIWTDADAQPLTGDLIRELLSGNLYLNVHTTAYPGGEVRGQILPTSGAGLTAHLTTGQVTSDVDSDGSGTASVQLTDAGVLYYVTVDGLTGDIGNAHFHEAAAGTDGGVVRGIMDDFDGNTAFGLWRRSDDEALTDELIQTLLEGGLYLNVHTAAYPGGEIRGQVYPSTGWGFHAELDTDQVTSEIDSDGSGTGTFTLTDAGLLFQVTLDGLTGAVANAHFHRAPAGTNGGVVRGIMDDFEGNTASGLWTSQDDEPLTDELIRELFAGNLYVNIHTAEYSGGEIRGQVLPRDGAELTARLTPEQEPGGVESDGSGTAALSLTDEGLAFRVTVTGLTGAIANAHFHRADIGINGGVVRGIMAEFEGNTASGVWTVSDGEALTDELIEALLQGELYLNIHTAENAGGEIRGQVMVSEGTGLRAFLTNEQVSGEIEQEGSGTAALTLTDRGLLYHVTVTGLSGAIANAHFHVGAAGVDGGVVHGIFDNFVGNTSSGLWPATGDQALTAEQIQALINGDYYINIHTAANAGGEIRGQVVPSSGIGSAVQLDPQQEGAGVESSGSGTASLSLTHAGLAYGLTATDLTGPVANAHFHNAPQGQNGGVVRGIFDDFSGGSAAGIWRPSDEEALTDDLMQELLSGNIYLNLHTAAYAGGEVRGQVLPGGVVSTAVEPVSGEIPTAFQLEQNYPNPFNPATTIPFSLAAPAQTRLAVYDLLGRRVATLVDNPLPAGSYRIRFDGRTLASGVYVYRLTAGDQQTTRRMLLLK